jgi:hypothetical protein
MAAKQGNVRASEWELGLLGACECGHLKLAKKMFERVSDAMKRGDHKYLGDSDCLWQRRLSSAGRSKDPDIIKFILDKGKENGADWSSVYVANDLVVTLS